MGGERRRDRGPERLADGAGDLLEPAQRRRAERLAQGHEAEPDPLDVPRREVVEPLPVPDGPRGAVAVGGRPAVADPRLGVLRGVLQLALDHPPVQPADASSHEPDPLVPLLAAAHLPVAQQLRDAARAPAPRRRPRPARARSRRPDRPPSRYSYDGMPGVRGVMTNGGLLTTRSNRSSATGSSIDPSRSSSGPTAGERRVEPRERERPPRDVGADHPPRVPRRVQRLDPAARAEVEHVVALVADRDLRQRGRRPADAEHVVGPQRAARWPARPGRTRSTSRPRRRRRPPCTGAGRRGRAPRRRRPRPGPAVRRRPRSSVGSARSSSRARRSAPEQERADQRRDDVVGSRRGRAQRRHGLLAVQRVGGDRPEHLLDAGDAVPGGRQVVAERRDERRIGQGRTGRGVESHPAIIPAPRPTTRPATSAHPVRRDARIVRTSGTARQRPHVRSSGRSNVRTLRLRQGAGRRRAGGGRCRRWTAAAGQDPGGARRPGPA